MSDVGAFGLLLSAAAHFYNWLNPAAVTVCGYHATGKSNLDYRLTTPCDVVPDYIPETHHEPVRRRDLLRWQFSGVRKQLAERYTLPPATRKTVVLGRDKTILKTTDIGGHRQYWDLSIEDAVMRKSRIILVLIDERDIVLVSGTYKPSCFIDSQVFFSSLTTSLITGRYNGKNMAVKWRLRSYSPDIVAIVANKALEHTKKDGSTEGGWLTEEEQEKGPITYRGHPLTRHIVFSKYKHYLDMLNVHLGIKTFNLVIDAKSGWGVSDSLKYLSDNL